MEGVVFHGKMPDPFLKEDGTRVTPDEWPTYKKALLEKIVDIEYGGMPPRPEVVEIEPLDSFVRGPFIVWYRIKAGTKEKQLTFLLGLTIPYFEEKGIYYMAPPQEDEKYPVILTGDGCYRNMERDSVEEANKRGFIAATFNRLELANDIKGSREGGIHDIYEGDYSDISAWAWGYSVCMDVFEKLSYVDETEVAITGHSRGGKTVMLAAAVDERIKYVSPNNSGCHGANSHKCQVLGIPGIRRETETMTHMLDSVPTWMGPKLEQYRGKPEELPYDMHFFGAMIAPRYYMQCEGMQDYWINPVGAWQNFAAVKACYKYLGCEENAGAWFRPGYHRHRLPEYTEFLDFIERAQKGLPLAEHLKINPYPDVPLNFDW